MLARLLLRSFMIAPAIAFGLAVGAAYGQSTRTVINAATNAVYPPMEIKDPKSGELIGFDVDLLNAIAARMGAKVNWTETSWQELLYAIKTKRADISISTKEDTPESRVDVSFVDYLMNDGLFYTLRANAASYPAIDDVCGKRVATSRNFRPGSVEKWSDQHCVKAGKPAVIVVGTQNSGDSRIQLDQGRVDVFTQSSIGMVYQNELSHDRYVPIGEPYEQYPVGIAFSKDDPQLGQDIKNALVAVIADGTYQQLLRKWKVPDHTAMERPMINGQP